MDYGGISHTVDRTGTCRLWEQQLVTSRVILVPEHGTENFSYKFFNLSVFISSHLFNDFTYANAFPVLAKGLDVLKLRTSAKHVTSAFKFPRTS